MRRLAFVRPVRRPVACAFAASAAACAKQAKRKQAAKLLFRLWPVACGGVRFVSPVACGGGGGIGGGLWPVPLRRSVYMWRRPLLRHFASAVACGGGGVSPPFPFVPCAVFATAQRLQYYRENRNAARRRRSFCFIDLCGGGLCFGLCGLCGGGGVCFGRCLCGGGGGLFGLCLFPCGLCGGGGGLCFFLCGK